jgi:hypothetical protein
MAEYIFVGYYQTYEKKVPMKISEKAKKFVEL